MNSTEIPGPARQSWPAFRHAATLNPQFSSLTPPALRAFTLIELLGVIAIMLTTANSSLSQTSIHHFGAITSQPDRSITLELLGSAPTLFRNYFDLYLLESSTDLLNWMPLTTLLRTNRTTNALIYVDAEARSFDRRFYRTPTNVLITPFPKPAGPFPVGIVSLLLSDPARTNRYRVRTNSSFMITLWYPCEVVSGALPGLHYDKRISQAYGLQEAFVDHAYPGAKVLPAPAPWPVILYSHGATSERKDNSAKMQELAGHGFVGVSIDHSDCFGTVFPDGTYYTSGISVSEVVTTNFFTNHVRDIQFVVAELERLNSRDGLFKDVLDLSRIGTMGWSFGGGPEAEFARTDDRVKAVIHLDAYLQAATTLIQTGLPKPFLGMYSTELGGDKRLFNRATRDAYYLQLRGSLHVEFADQLVFNPTDAVRRKTTVQSALIISFFDKYLKASNDGLLDDNPTNRFPEVITFLKK